MNLIFRVWSYVWPEARKYKTSLALIFIGYTVGIIFDSILKPYIYKEIIDVFVTQDISPKSLHSVLILVVFCVIVIVFHNIGYRVGDYATSYFQSKVMRDLYDSTIKKLFAHSYEFFSNSFSGGIVAKAKRFSKSFETLMDIISFQVWFSFVTLSGVITVLFLEVPIVAWLFLVWTILYLAVTFIFIRKKLTLDEAEAEADSKVISHLADIITNILTIKVFSASRREEISFKKVTQNEEEKRYRAWTFANFQSLVQAVLMGVLQISVLFLNVYLWYNNLISVSTIVLIQFYIFGLFDILWNLGRSITKAMKALSDMKEAVDIFDQHPDIVDSQETQMPAEGNGLIEFNAVSFEYIKGTAVFNNFNINIKPGERVGIVGRSGSGKSTITKLLLRFQDVSGGSILINGQDVREIKQDDLRNLISYVPQESILFHRTIKENISYGKPGASDSEIIDVAKRAHAHEFISNLTKGYDTLVGERGIKLSGGERQRIAIARSMLKSSPILILDEATSSLDSLSEKYIQESFVELMKDRTTIVIAHRLSTIQKMDRIIVLDNGKIVEEGGHQELLNNKSFYYELWIHQNDGFIE